MVTGLQAMTLACNVMNALSPGSLLARKALVIAPHPDDEFVGLWRPHGQPCSSRMLVPHHLCD